MAVRLAVQNMQTVQDMSIDSAVLAHDSCKWSDRLHCAKGRVSSIEAPPLVAIRSDRRINSVEERPRFCTPDGKSETYDIANSEGLIGTHSTMMRPCCENLQDVGQGVLDRSLPYNNVSFWMAHLGTRVGRRSGIDHTYSMQDRIVDVCG